MANEFRIEYGIKGEERKRLVKAVAEYMETFSEYCGAPTFAYTVDYITIDKNGTLSFDDRADSEQIEGLIEYLAGKGYTPGGSETEIPTEETVTEPAQEETDAETTEEPAEETAAPEIDKLAIEMPRDGFTEEALDNLQKLIDGKASLLKKSLGTDDLTIEVTEDRVRFPWFTDPDPMSTQAYIKLITAICKMAKEAKRVTATDHEVESEKYAFRTWLLRLGFIGAEYKNDRAILMKNLSGTAAFKNAKDAQEFADRQKAKRDAAKAAALAEKEAEDADLDEEEDADDEISE